MSMIPHPRAKELERVRLIKEREIKKKEKEIRAKEDRILLLADKVAIKSFALKQDNAKAKANRVANARLVQHHEFEAIDAKKHPSDRSFDIRMYTKMDLDVWKYHEVRDWFNSGAPKDLDMSYKLTPADTGYMVRVGPGYKEPRHANYEHGDTPRQPYMSRTHLSNNIVAMASPRPWP
jgi:hypothetical protein